jgi:tetratricopeptide (TPR) repeat protein
MKVRALDDALHERIKALCAEGDELAAAGAFEAALEKYGEAWMLLPDPKEEWGASTWILAAIADASFLGGHNEWALDALEHAMTCPDAIGNPFLHLRYGQVLFDLGELSHAADELIRAYMGAGEEIFAAEDPRYLDFLKTRAIL